MNIGYPRNKLIAIGGAVLVGGCLVGGATQASEPAATASTTASKATSAFDPIDPQNWEDQDDMTWADYNKVPDTDWVNPNRKPTQKKLKIALVPVDYPDQPFVMTQDKKSDPFGNPQIDPVDRADIPKFYERLYDKPSKINHGHTVNEYWMEQTDGRIGVDFDAFGPYRMSKPYWEYGINDIGQEGEGCPSGHTCDADFDSESTKLWTDDVGKQIPKKYDRVMKVYAGYDETSVWQEFGEMKFQTKEDIPDSWGPPDPDLPNWVRGRYTDWTSWRAGSQMWGHSGIRQGESSGTITHEISHTFGIGDNANNPYVTPYHRSGTGPFDLMDRGSFNGPGGPHSRWQVPANQGAALPGGQTLRTKLKLGFIHGKNVITLSRDALKSSGIAVFDIEARTAKTLRRDIKGVQIKLSRDHTPPCDIDTDPLCAGPPVYSDYTLETVQRIGADSFTPDHGVMITKNKPFDDEDDSCGYLCFSWMIDANPQDIDMVDYYRPGDGTPVMRSIGDYRQLNDGLFHAGTNSGSEFEYVDKPNRLHFYVIDKHKSRNGELSYTVAVKSLDGDGGQRRGVRLGKGDSTGDPAGNGAVCSFDLTNTGQYRGGGQAQPEDVTDYLKADVFRLNANASGSGWRVWLPNKLATAQNRASDTVTASVSATSDASARGTVTMTARSVSDPSKHASATCTVRS